MASPSQVVNATGTIRSPFSPDAHERVASYFLGNKAENFAMLLGLFTDVLDAQVNARRSYHPEDEAFITPEMQGSPAFKEGADKLKKELDELNSQLKEFSIPFYSPRYAGHMCFETSMPAILGWMTTIFNNPNNVAFEASPITTMIELRVGRQMCRMLGYEAIEDKQDSGWGHIACDGTVANLESIWAARNLKFYPLSLRKAMKPDGPLNFVADTFKVHPCAEPQKEVIFSELSTWGLLNLRPEEILSIPNRLQEEYGITSAFLQDCLKPYIIQTISKDILEKEYGIEHPIQYLVSSTKHYSWPKGAAIAGIGSENMVNVPVDIHARMDMNLLRKELDARLKRKQAVYAVIAVIGTTEEGAVDPLEEIIQIRKDYQDEGMSFIVHVDAAWGGYFASMIRERYDLPDTESPAPSDDVKIVPSVTLRPHTVDQFKALKDSDSITIDPHKSGYIPYPAGGLCYKDGRMRFLLTWAAPYIQQSKTGDSIGIYGVEGSKPGAPAAAAYLHHAVVGLHKEGHGMLLGEVSFTCSRISAHWAAMSVQDDPYIVVPFNPLPSETQGPEEVEKEKQYIRKKILPASNMQLIEDEEAMRKIRELGSDLNINAFACNFKIDGKPNEDVEEANYLNSRLYQSFSITTPKKPANTIPLYLSATTLGMEDYGHCCTHFKQRIGLETESEQDLFVLRNVVMSPFQTAGGFVSKIADIFQKTLERETENLVARNTISPETLKFLMQGTDKLFLVYQPHFHKANGRFQLILEVSIDKVAMNSYVKARAAHPGEVYKLETEHTTIAELLETHSVSGTISGKGLTKVSVKVTNIRAIKERPLNSRWRDRKYPDKSMPFYLYGNPQQPHIDHVLLRAPNTQISADQVDLKLDKALTEEELQKGAIALLHLSEASMQPMDHTTNPSKFFAPGKTFRVSVYADRHPAQAHGPGLANVNADELLAKGTLTLGPNVYIDYTSLNIQEFHKALVRGHKADIHHVKVDYTSRITDIETRDQWKEMLRKAMPPA